MTHLSDIKIIYNCQFYVDGQFIYNRAILIQGGLIREFIDADISKYPDAEKIDLQGAYLYPGFIDAHTHSYSGGLYVDGIDLSECKTIAEVLMLIEAAARQNQDLTIAWRFDENSLQEKRFPTVAELDSVCPKTKLLFRRIDGHSCILNTEARNAVPGLVYKDEVLTGEANDFAVNWLQDNCSEEVLMKAYHSAAQQAMLGGFTRIHTMIGDAEHSNQHWSFLANRLEEFPITFVLYPQSFNIEDALRLGAKRIGGCILADGSIGSHTAALSTRYADKDTRGNLYHDNDFWRSFVKDASDNGLQVCVHCIGDAAIKLINDAYLSVGYEKTHQLRHQLIHCELTPDALVEEISCSGAVPVMQPMFDRLWGGPNGLYEERLGISRSRQMNRLGSLFNKGVRVCGSSDWYVTELNIAKSIHAAVHHHNPEERLTNQQAIQMYTENNAWLDGDESRLGQIQPGYIADLTALNTDLTSDFDPEQCVTKFIIREGKVVYAQ